MAKSLFCCEATHFAGHCQGQDLDSADHSPIHINQLKVNLEYLGRVVFNINGVLYPDSVVGTDSHITMIDGLGVARWGVGGIEAEAAMLGQPMSMVLPGVVGFKLLCKLRDGVTATNLVLTVTQMLRKHGVVGKFVEFYGEGMSELSLADRATIANIVSICDDMSFLLVSMIESYLRANKMFVDYNEDFTVPKESQNKVAAFTFQGTPAHLRHGDVVIAAIITSCTNTSNPSVMLGVALVAKKACEFEGRIHPLTRSNYLSSPPLVVVYALAGTVCDL
ncbi:hypothetical protein JHK82_028088 [Glycine max]|nr:hypothetical protein JHK85_028753 [Glycine max]KAG5004072.1 hypothetical protein JHK86_028211 [Glycine max]KAG5127253.1 hypothetical protein JHK82_028088 [Glycine max]KAG5151867.1 hypothetical protein JHK84_028339 [Glycine max]